MYRLTTMSRNALGEEYTRTWEAGFRSESAAIERGEDLLEDERQGFGCVIGYRVTPESEARPPLGPAPAGAAPQLQGRGSADMSIHSFTAKQAGGDAIEQYIGSLRADGFAVSTIRQREARLRYFGKPIDEVTHEDILRMIPTHLKPATRRVYFNDLRWGCLDMLRLGLIERDPTVGMRTPKVGRSAPRPFTPSEQELLLAMAGRERDWTVLGMFAGLRASDVVQVEHAHLEQRGYGWALRIPNGKGRVDATIPAHDSVVAVLEEYAHTTGPIWPIRPDTMSPAWSAAARAVGVLGKFHQNRHTYGTRLYQSTGDIAVTSRLMRHANLATTMVYAEISGEQEYAAVSRL